MTTDGLVTQEVKEPVDIVLTLSTRVSLQWRHNERDGVSNHQPHDCLLNRLLKAQIEENITGDRWIPRTKGQ